MDEPSQLLIRIKYRREAEVSCMKDIRVVLAIEAAAFALAALVHRGILVDGYQHREAAIAESVIAAVLAAGLIISLLRPRLSRRLALGVQAFALFGTAVGISTIAIGVGPQTLFDLLLHLGFVALLVSGLVIAVRSPAIAAPRG
jgi:hypothetical protein